MICKITWGIYSSLHRIRSRLDCLANFSTLFHCLHWRFDYQQSATKSMNHYQDRQISSFSMHEKKYSRLVISASYYLLWLYCPVVQSLKSTMSNVEEISARIPWIDMKAYILHLLYTEILISLLDRHEINKHKWVYHWRVSSLFQISDDS
jgi:hypothetical protein